MDWIGSPPSLPFIPILLDQFQIQFIDEQLQCGIASYHLLEHLTLSDTVPKSVSEIEG